MALGQKLAFFGRPLLVSLLLIALLPAVLMAQESSPPADDSGENPFREQTIYIPYSKLRSLFEKEGRGVFLPYEQFQSLWEAARSKIAEPPEIKPPLRSLITEIDSQATISEDVMSVTAELKIDLLVEGWHEIPLRLNGAAIQRAMMGEENGRIIFDPNRGYLLLLENKEKQAQSVAVSLQYAKAFEQSPGKNYVEFLSPQAPINRWRIEVPEQGVDIQVQPNIASQDLQVETTPADPVAPATEEPTGKSIVQAFVGGADRVRIDWTAKAEGAAGLSALITVETRQQITIEEGVIRTRAQLIYDISRADVDSLEIQVPADHNVVNVFDPNLQKWEKTLDGDVQTLNLTLFQPTRGTQPVVIELEKFAGGKEMSRPMMQTEVVAPVIRATRAGIADTQVNVGRQQGMVVVKVDSSLRGETVNRSGLTQIDPSELPAELAGQVWSFAYRYASVPFDLRLSVEKLLPEVDVEQLTEAFVQPEKLTATLTATFDIKRAGIFQIELLVPADFTVRSVQGLALGDAQPLIVESFNLAEVAADADPASDRTLIVNLGKRAMGKTALVATLDRALSDPNLAQPTGASSQILIPVPRVKPESVNSSRGKLVLLAPESLRLNPSTVNGVSPIAVGEAYQPLPSQRQGRFPQLREIAAYAYTQQLVDLQFDAQRRKPFIEARQFLSVNVDSGVASFESTFLFDIRYSGIDSLRLDIPSALADTIRNDSTGLREQVTQPQPEGIDDGYVAWTLSGEGELLGAVVAKLSWEQQLGDLPVGTAVPIAIPRLIPQGVDRAWGQIVASKAETIEISVSGDPEGLRPIDPQRDLMSEFGSLQAARAFEFYNDWSLVLQATRYELEEVKRTSIDLAFLRMVRTRSQEVSVQALYRLRSARQRIAIQIPGVDPGQTSNSLDAQPLRINGQPALLEHDGTQFFIPYTGFSPNESVLVELRYTLTGGGDRLEVPQFPEEPAIQQVYLAAYIPDDLELLFVDGPWTDETEPSIWSGPVWEFRSDEDLLAELRQGAAVSGLAGQDFPIDGQRFLFSTLRPEPGADGALKLATSKELVFHTAIVLVLAAIGILLCFRPFLTRVWWLALLATFVVVSAIFAPRFAEAVWSEPFYITVLLTVGLWAVQGVVGFVPKVGQWVRQVLEPAPAPLVAAGVGVVETHGSTDQSASSQANADVEVLEIRDEGASPPAPPLPESEEPKQGGDDHE